MHLHAVAIAYRFQVFAHTGRPPERADVHNQKQQDDGTQQTHGPAVPPGAAVAQRHLITHAPPPPVLHRQLIALNDMDKKAKDDYGGAHKVRRPVKHFAVVGRIEKRKIGKNAGIKAAMDYQK